MLRATFRTITATIICVTVSFAAGADGQTVDFRRDVQPILETRCFECHGPSSREGGLRLTSRRDALATTDSGRPVIVPGHADASLLLKRISSDDSDTMMPPAGDRLTKLQIQTLTSWIESGAEWTEDEPAAKHWAYVKPRRPEPPDVRNAAWPTNAIDRFVLSNLERRDLQPSPLEERARLLRRISLTLTGLPPTVQEVDAFVADDSPDACEQVVDRLLASDHFGEHWARPWLDLARYADSNGFQADQLRESWAYRDWVINALNSDMPYDRFVTEQIAGDLLPNATVDQKIATGFHRTVTCNVEAGVHPEENRVNQVIDRVNTTGTVFLGTTLECCQCHNHKYDPFTQDDYYRLFAYFNNTPLEVKLTSGVSYDFNGPWMELPTEPSQQHKCERLQRQLDELKQKQKAADKSSDTKELGSQISGLQQQIDKLRPPSTLVMVELDQPRETFVMLRGDYLNPGSRVNCGTPAALHESLESQPANRLGLAQWLVSPDNPLLARVAVNRLWAECFGHGIVATAEDFGTQGEPPTHPELLDWLACEFMEPSSGAGPWSTKHILKLIVMSSTFRQSSRVDAATLAVDPQNTLYTRGPRFRMSAETIRDNSLAVSGLLSSKMHGPPIMPFQPDGIWRQVGRNAPVWQAATDEDRFRRGIYVVWRRAAPYPSFVNFDAPDRASCVTRRPRSNTPLQALTLLNDPAYVEMALSLAHQMMTHDNSANPRTIAVYGMKRCVAREPTSEEVDHLLSVFEVELARLRQAPAEATAIVDGVEGFRPPDTVDAIELAAWFHVANVLLNLDETMTR
ncbi:MAG: DUF1553 domain-containing protein [Planctomycetaceae bacterium]